MAEGSCLCGAVTYRVSGDIGDVVRCYCGSCQRVTGSAFATVGQVPGERFELLSGKDNLQYFESSPGKKRYFCNRCGSPVFVRTDAQLDIVRLRIGGLKTPEGVNLRAHIFVDEKASWYQIGDDLPQFGGWPKIE